MTTSCILGRILCFSSSLFGPVLLFLLMLIWQHFMLLLKFIWSRFILFIFASLVPFYAGFFCTFPSPRQAIYSHQSRPGARPSFAPTKPHYCYFVLFQAHDHTFLVQLPFCIEVYYFIQKVNVRKSLLKKSHLVVLPESITHQGVPPQYLILLLLLWIIGVTSKGTFAPWAQSFNHWIRANNCFFKKNTYKCINV